MGEASPAVRVCRRISVKLDGQHGCKALRSAWCWLLHETCGEDLITAAASSHRYEGSAADEQHVGLYVNMLPMRTKRTSMDKQSFMRSVEDVRRTGLQNQLPFAYLLDEFQQAGLRVMESMQQHPIFRIQSLLILLEGHRDDLKLKGLQPIPRLVARGMATKHTEFRAVSKVDLTLRVDIFPDHCQLSFDYVEDVFEQSWVEQWANEYVKLVAEFKEAGS